MKRIISVLLVATLSFGLFVGCKGNGASVSNEPVETMAPMESSPTDNKPVTRGEWIEMLGDTFGLDTYEQEAPYYSDVPRESEIFDCVQAAAEWKITDIFGSELEPDKPITVKEMAMTAAYAAGEEFANEDDALKYAIDQGIINSEEINNDTVNAKCANDVLDATRDIYLTDSGENIVAIDYTDNVVNLPDNLGVEMATSGSQIIMPGSIMSDDRGSLAVINTTNGMMEVHSGDVLIIPPSSDYPSGYAYKIVGMSQDNGEILFETIEPEIDDLFDKLDIHTTISADSSDIIWEDGIEAAMIGTSDLNSGTTYHISWLNDNIDAPKAELLSKSAVFSHDFTFGEGNVQKTWSNKNSASVAGGEGAAVLEDSNFVYYKQPGIEDFENGTEPWTEKLEIENKYSSGYKVDGNITINYITVTPEVYYEKAWFIKYPVGASLKVDSGICANLSIEGNLSEKLKIGTVPIPLPGAPMAVKIDLYLYLDASGRLQVGAEFSNSAKVEFNKMKLKHSASSNVATDMDMAISCDFGTELVAGLELCGVIRLMEASAKVGGNLLAEAHVAGEASVGEEDGKVTTLYSESMNIGCDLYAPIISVAVGESNTLVGKLGLSKTWDVATRSKGAKKFELLKYEWTFWQEKVISDEEGNVENSITEDNSELAGPVDENMLDLKTYSLTLQGEPKQLELDLHGATAAPEVSWQTSDPSIAVVDQNGVVTPVSEGIATITVSLNSNPAIEVKCVVFVQNTTEQKWEFLPEF